MHAAEYLKSPEKHPIGPVVAAYGAELFLRHEAIHAVCRQVLGGEDADAEPVRMPGEQADLRDVLDTLRTISMWSARQVVIVEAADEFVSEHREALENYVDKPARKSVLVLELKSFPSNTKLAKKVAASGLTLECSPLTPAAVPGWVIEQAKQRFGKRLDRQAAQQLVELAGNELGLLVQELSKLATYVGESPTVTTEAVQAVVGGWRMRTTWEMIDAVLAGQPGAAVRMLDKLLESGDAAAMILGGVNWMFRPLAQAAELTRQGQPLPEALAQAGVRFNNVRNAENYMRRIGYEPASRIGQKLLQADLDLKGGSGLNDRTIVERLLVQLAGSGK